MMDNPLVSVIIVNHNSNDKISRCVESILKIKMNVDVIIVDNASTDNSLALLEDGSSNYPNIKILRNIDNRGFSVACNQGADIAQGQYLLYLNPDCEIQEDTIPGLMECLQSDNAIGMVGGLLLNPDGSEQVGGRRSVPTPWRTLVRVFKLSYLEKRYPKLFSDFNLHNQPLPSKPIEVEAISGACMMVRREAVDDVGGLDEEYFLHCEDLDWCMRLRQKGWKIYFVPDAKLTHFIGSCSQSRPIFVEWNKHKGMMRFYRKFFRHQYPGVLMWVVTVGVWLRFSALVMLFTTRRLFGNQAKS